MHKIKKLIILPILLLNGSILFSLSVGISGKTTAIKLIENKYLPDFLTDVQNNIYLNYDFNLKGFFFNFSPALNITDELKFNFKSLSVLYAADYFTFSFAKKNIYFGNGLDVNPLFYNLPVTNAYEDNLWNVKLSYINDNINLNLGTVIDSDKIDDFSKPEWHNYYFTSLLSNENLSLYFNIDFLSSSDKELKLASEFDFTQIKNLTLYTAGDYLIKFDSTNSNSYELLMGVSYFISGNKFEQVYIAEAGMYNNKFFTSICANWKLFEYFDFEEKLNYIDEKLYLSSLIDFVFDSGRLKIEYKSTNLIKPEEKNDCLSISYELEGRIK